MKDNQKTKKQLIDELDMLRQKVAAFEIAGSQPVATGLRDASKAQQEDNAAKPKRKEGRSFQEEKLNLVIEESGLIFWEWDIKHDRKVFNAIWAEKLGYTLEEFNHTFQESSLVYFQHPEDLPAAQQAMKDCLTGKAPLYKAEYRMRTKTGDWKWMLALGKIIERNAEGKPTHMTGVNIDISERKRAEEALRQSEERFRTLVENIPGAVYRCEPTPPWRTIHISSGIEVISGFPVRDFLDNTILFDNFEFPEDIEMVNRAILTGIADKKPYVIEYRIRHVDGSIRWVYEKGRAIYSEQGQPLWLDGVLLDVTERKRAEEKLRESETQYRELFNNISSGVAIYEVRDNGNDFIFKDFNKAGERINGDRKEDVLGKSIFEVRPGIKEFGLLDVFKRVWKTGVPEHFSAQIYQDNRLFGWYENYVYMLPSGEIITAYDNVTENKLAEQALRVSEDRFRTLVENIPGAVYRCEPTLPWRVIYFSNEIEVITGYPVKVFLENIILINDITLPEDLEMVNKALETSIAGRQPYTIEYRIRHADGSIRWVYEKGRAVYSEQGEPLWLDGVYMEITERKRTEEALREAQKLASIVSLAAGMAHEINSPLQVITGLTERITAQLESNQLDQSKLPRDIANINRLGWRIAHIIRSLLTYVSEMRGQVAPHDFNEIIKDTLLLTEPQLKTWLNVNVLTDLGENLPPLFCERNQIVQTLINLLTNAHDAMPNGGEISIHTRYDADGKRFALQVSDTGSGIPKAIQKKIFDPFFTTKEVGQGTGLGLSIVFGVVKAHGGEIEVESAPKQGTTFTIYLPKEPIQKPVSEPRAKNHGRY